MRVKEAVSMVNYEEKRGFLSFVADNLPNGIYKSREMTKKLRQICLFHLDVTGEMWSNVYEKIHAG